MAAIMYRPQRVNPLQHSFHMKAALPLANRIATVSDQSKSVSV